MVRAETATVSISELEFEVPPGQGEITTVESVIQQAITNLEMEQPYRMVSSDLYCMSDELHVILL